MPDPTKGAPAAPATQQAAPQAQGSLDPAILSALGLKPDASAADVAQAIQALNAQVQQLTAATADTQADKDLQDFSDVVGNKDQQTEIKKQLVANRSGTIALLTAIRSGKKTSAINRSGNKLPADVVVSEDAETKEAETIRSAKISNRAAEIQKTQKLPFHVAWNRAVAEFPTQKETSK